MPFFKFSLDSIVIQIQVEDTHGHKHVFRPYKHTAEVDSDVQLLNQHYHNRGKDKGFNDSPVD